MNVAKIVIVNELPRTVRTRLEIESAPGDQRSGVRKPGKVEIRFGVKFRHGPLVRKSKGSPVADGKSDTGASEMITEVLCPTPR